MRNVVLMGMGEPLHNYDPVMQALKIISHQAGTNIGPARITVSTVGVVPGILRLADEPWPVSLAISLHAADDELRSRLVPLNDRYPLRDLVDAAAVFYAAKGRRVSIEWTLIDGVNDTPEQAAKLARIAAELHAHVNVIAVNPTPLSQDLPPPRSRVAEFLTTLGDAGVNATERDTRGQEIDAACGQLRVRAAGSSPA